MVQMLIWVSHEKSQIFRSVTPLVCLWRPLEDEEVMSKMIKNEKIMPFCGSFPENCIWNAKESVLVCDCVVPELNLCPSATLWGVWIKPSTGPNFWRDKL